MISLQNFIFSFIIFFLLIIFRRGRKIRKGYMGHIIRMANELVRFGNIEDNIERQLKANPQWSQFVNSSLKKQNETNNTVIGGYNPRNFISPSMESSFGVMKMINQF